MKYRFILISLILFFNFPVLVFSQQNPPPAGVLRNYVGLINQNYHPGIVEYFEKTKKELEKNGQSNAVKAIDLFLRGATGSGFVIAGANGNYYIVTNYHVIQQAHTLSITFESQDNSKKKYENLTVIAVDEELDLALLAFSSNDKPSSGLIFVTRRVEEGEDVYAAGFPALGITPLWQFSRGMVSNASATFAKSLNDETLMGPYIQHTAQIDPGNSGGPLLVVQRNAASGYAVAGINTLSASRRQAANYAIPAASAVKFISAAINQKPETYKAALEEQIDRFLKGLNQNKAVYPHIAEFLSSVCVGENAEYAMAEMFDKGSSTLRRAFIEKCEESVVGAMGYAVAWTIENDIREQSSINAVLKEIIGDGEEYTVVFTINKKDVSSVWIREYGNWRIKSFGSAASGDKSIMTKKAIEKKAKENLRLDSEFHLELGYANLFEKAPTALYCSLEYMNMFVFNMYYVDSDLFCFGYFMGYRWSLPAGNLGFMPYIRFGANYITEKGYKDYEKEATANHELSGFPIVLSGLLGLKITNSYIPGLFFGTAFQFGIYNMTKYDKFMKKALCFTVGYAF